MEQVLIKDKKYSGKYVAVKDFDNPTVVAFGKNPEKVYKEAQRKQCSNPVLLYVPAKGIVQIY